MAKNDKTWRLVLVALGVIVIGLAAVYWTGEGGVFHRDGFSTSANRLLVLEDCDRDFRTPPFEDAVITFDAKGKPVRKVTGLNICETVGGCRSLSVAKDGGFFTVCESVGQKLSAYQLKTAERLWSLNGQFNSAAVSQNAVIYALTSSGTIYGDQLLVIDQEGRTLRQAPVGGFDLAIDEERNVLWLVGKNIKKCDLEGKVVVELNCIGWCAVSVDLGGGGSVWVAERQHPDLAGSTNRLLQISPEGRVLKAVGLPFSPLCLRVDRSDGNVWVTGSEPQKSVPRRLLDAIEKHTGRLPIGKTIREFLTRPYVWYETRKYNQNGAVLCAIRKGGFSLDIDQVDGSVWIGGREKVYHYSRQGSILGQCSGISPDQKYIAVVPRPSEHNVYVPPGNR
jgi:hypothetical protein